MAWSPAPTSRPLPSGYRDARRRGGHRRGMARRRRAALCCRPPVIGCVGGVCSPAGSGGRSRRCHCVHPLPRRQRRRAGGAGRWAGGACGVRVPSRARPACGAAMVRRQAGAGLATRRGRVGRGAPSPYRYPPRRPCCRLLFAGGTPGVVAPAAAATARRCQWGTRRGRAAVAAGCSATPRLAAVAAGPRFSAWPCRLLRRRRQRHPPVPSPLERRRCQFPPLPPCAFLLQAPLTQAAVLSVVDGHRCCIVWRRSSCRVRRRLPPTPARRRRPTPMAPTIPTAVAVTSPSQWFTSYLPTRRTSTAVPSPQPSL